MFGTVDSLSCRYGTPPAICLSRKDQRISRSLSVLHRTMVLRYWSSKQATTARQLCCPMDLACGLHAHLIRFCPFRAWWRIPSCEPLDPSIAQQGPKNAPDFDLGWSLCLTCPPTCDLRILPPPRSHHFHRHGLQETPGCLHCAVFSGTAAPPRFQGSL